MGKTTEITKEKHNAQKRNAEIQREAPNVQKRNTNNTKEKTPAPAYAGAGSLFSEKENHETKKQIFIAAILHIALRQLMKTAERSSWK